MLGENPFQQFWVTVIIVGQQQIPKIFGKKLVLLDPSNASCWMFSNIEDAAEKISQHCCLVIFLANDSNCNLPS